MPQDTAPVTSLLDAGSVMTTMMGEIPSSSAPRKASTYSFRPRMLAAGFLILLQLTQTTYGWVPPPNVATVGRLSTHFLSAANIGIDETKMAEQKSEKILPKIIVFDLDNTVWTPELYQLRKLQRANQVPIADEDVSLFQGARELLYEADHPNYLPTALPEVSLAIASRTKSVEWAHALLGQYGLKSILSHIEIFPGHKRQHFSNIFEACGGQVEYKDMLFLDDARNGRFGNCEPIADLGCLAVHTPNGLHSADILHQALDHFHTWRTQHNAMPGCIVEADGSLSLPQADEERQVGVIKLLKERFGFISHRKGPISRDLFFHFNDVSEKVDVWQLREGIEVTFVKKRDSANPGKWMAIDVTVSESDTSSDQEESDLIDFKAFSMNQPFAALLANGFKTLETRNGTMFEPYVPGSWVLLHVGQRTYPDGDRHLEIMKRAGKSSDEIAQLKQFPQGFGKGNIVAIMELGETWLTTLDERSEPDHEHNAAAYGRDSGKFATKIRRVAYLKRPIKMKGQPGLFKVRIPADALPDDWREDVDNARAASSGEKETFVASISG